MTVQGQARAGEIAGRGVAGVKSGKTPGVPETPPPGPGELQQTPQEIEGPYFRLGAPQRSNLLEPGDKPEIVLTGRVLNQLGAPIPGADVHFWTSDGVGTYDDFYHPALMVPCTIDADGVKHGRFDFVIKQVTEAENVTPESLAARV